MRNRTRTVLAVLALGMTGAGFPLPTAAQEIGGVVETAPPPEMEADEAEAKARPASDSVMRVIAWVTASGDNGGLPFVIIDKVTADVFVFDADARFLGATPALLGSAPGDDSVEGVGDRELSAIKPDERTTPAGRFLAGFGYASGQRKVLWIDYAPAISLHPVVYANKKEKRLARLYSPSPEDNRITFGCINISAAFYENVVRPLFSDTRGVVYILPDTKPLDEVFPTLAASAQPSLAREGAP
jgi:hypothetical protein